jgi:hypothetical protein
MCLPIENLSYLEQRLQDIIFDRTDEVWFMVGEDTWEVLLWARASYSLSSCLLNTADAGCADV